MSNQIRSEQRIKQDAKSIKKKLNCTHSEALDLAVQKYGFINFHSYKIALKSQITLVPINRLRNEITKRAIEYSIFIPTETAFKKNIIDATAPIRDLFELEKFHSYENQQQEPGHKIKTTACFVTPKGNEKTIVSLYRPRTKKGDPRMWFRGLHKFAAPDDKIAIVFYQRTPYLLNLSNIKDITFLTNFLDSIVLDQPIANELLSKLKELAGKPLKTSIKGDTAVGMAIEEALGISANSSKLPDYKGIELKSTRRKKTPNRNNLFAQVANWKISKLKSSRQILEKYGYERDGGFKLNCTVSASKPNSQGLQFEVTNEDKELHEIHVKDGPVVTWDTSLLKQRLLEKHAETFWVKVDAKEVNGEEHFYLHSIIHTKMPLISQFVPLLKEGIITMDHLIKFNKKGSPEERGPLFKILPSNINLLFPEPVEYDLRN